MEVEKKVAKKGAKLPTFLVTKRKPVDLNKKRSVGNPTRYKLVKSVIREVAGYAPYEKRLLELIRVSTVASMKRALKLAKKRLGTHKRGKAKRDELVNIINEMKKRTY